MFYSVYVLTKKGFLAPIWTEGTIKNRLPKKQVLNSNIKTMCVDVIDPKCGPLALRLSAILLLGIIRIHNRKCKYLLTDTNDAFGRVHSQKQVSVDLPTDILMLRNDKIDLPLNDQLLYKSILDSSPSQMGLDPILDSLDLEGASLIIDDGLNETLLGMITPLSDVSINASQTLHQLMDASSQFVSDLHSSNPVNQEMDMDMDMAPFTSGRITLSPPKLSPRKRMVSTVSTDLHIEINESVWKKQHIDIAYLVEKRPPLPLLNGTSSSMNQISPVYHPRILEYLQYYLDHNNTSINSVAGSIEKRRGLLNDEVNEISARNEDDNMDMDMDMEPEQLSILPEAEIFSRESLGILGKVSISSASSASSTPSHQNTLRLLTLLEEAGMKSRSISFDHFTYQKRRHFASKCFYHLLILASENQVMVNQQQAYGDIEISEAVSI